MIPNRPTICAIATPSGSGAIALIRVTGSEAFAICDQIFVSKRGSLSQIRPYSLVFGEIRKQNELIDEVLVSVFQSPKSYTGEDMVEISCHASSYVQNAILRLLLDAGAQLAQPGEFTQRAFLNGKLDLSQAEAVADLIASSSQAAHRVAMQQMRGGYSEQIKELRTQLLHFISLIELELDFSEEDVEFADRDQLSNLLRKIHKLVSLLTQSFAQGNAMKNGIPVAIVGQTNVGKSTLLNALLGEERAIVSDVAGTTRDTIEDTLNIEGMLYRFIDTAGIRQTRNEIEAIGIGKTFEKIAQAAIILLLLDNTASTSDNKKSIQTILDKKTEQQALVVVANKSDLATFEPSQYPELAIFPTVALTAKGQEISALREALTACYETQFQTESTIIVSNLRHYEILQKAQQALERVTEGLNNQIPSDLISQDIREALHYLGEITGEINTDEILGNIFKNFCIGK